MILLSELLLAGRMMVLRRMLNHPKVLHQIRVAQLSLLSQYREQVKQAEHLYKEAKGIIDVSKSKAELALCREGYLIEQVHRVADSFKCEHPPKSSNASFYVSIRMIIALYWQLSSLIL